jgi:LysR family glycine cleavage system transcriptional activator
MSDSLLSLASLMEPLRGFVAVGRRMSITLAANDLCLTQSALSRQVQALEERLGAKLFVRGHRSIAFTTEGERLFRSADAAIQQLQDALDVVRIGARRAPVTLSASIGVTALWVLPRIGRFQSLHPDIDLRVAADNRLVDLASEGIDMAIRYGPHSGATSDAIFLFSETISPIAHPSLGIQRIMSPKDLAGQVLLEYDDPGRPWLHWEDWFASLGWKNVRPKAVLRFNQYDQVVQSAIAGQGIALGRIELIQTMLADKRVILLNTPHTGPTNEHAYWLIGAKNAVRTEADAVKNWIESEAQTARGLHSHA